MITEEDGGETPYATMETPYDFNEQVERIMKEREAKIVHDSKEFNYEMQELADESEADSMRDYIEQGDEE